MLERSLTSLIASVLRISPNRVTRDADLVDDLGADSLALAQIAAGVEEQLGTRLPADKLQHLLTVGDLFDALADLGSTPTVPPAESEEA